MKVFLVYQAGIANVFKVDSFNLADYGREATRLHQGSFDSARYFAQGMGAAGAVVRSAHCNEAGDIARRHWSEEWDSAPFNPSPLTIN